MAVHILDSHDEHVAEKPLRRQEQDPALSTHESISGAILASRARLISHFPGMKTEHVRANVARDAYMKYHARK